MKISKDIIYIIWRRQKKRDFGPWIPANSASTNVVKPSTEVNPKKILELNQKIISKFFLTTKMKENYNKFIYDYTKHYSARNKIYNEYKKKISSIFRTSDDNNHLNYSVDILLNKLEQIYNKINIVSDPKTRKTLLEYPREVDAWIQYITPKGNVSKNWDGSTNLKIAGQGGGYFPGELSMNIIQTSIDLSNHSLCSSLCFGILGLCVALPIDAAAFFASILYVPLVIAASGGQGGKWEPTRSKIWHDGKERKVWKMGKARAVKRFVKLTDGTCKAQFNIIAKK